MRYKNVFILLLTQLFFTNNIQAQRLDSLLHQFEINKDEKQRLDLSIALSLEYEDINPDKGIQFSDKAIEIAQNLNRDDRLSDAYLSKGENNYLINAYDTSIAYINMALAINKKSENKQGIVACLNDLGRATCTGTDYKKAISYLNEALNLSKLFSNKEQTAKIFANMGVYNVRLYNYTEAIKYFQKAQDIYEILLIKKEYARMLSSIGKCYYKTANFSKSLEYFQRSLKLNEQIKNKPGIAYNYYWLGLLYNNINALKAIEYFQSSLAIYEKLNAKYYVANILNDIGSAYTAIADSGRITDYHQKSIAYYTKSLRMNEQLNNQSGIALNLANLAFDYICSADFLNAMKCLKRALKIDQERDETFLIADCMETMALIYYRAPEKDLIALGINPNDKYDIAIEQMKNAFRLFKEIGNTVRQTWELLRIQELYIKLNHYDSAYKYYKQFIELRDSTFNIEKEKGIITTELQYQFSKKEDSLKFHQQLTDEKLKGQMLIAKQQEQQLEINKKEKDLQKLAYLNTQADLQNEQLEKKAKEKQLTLSEKEKQLQLANVKTLIQEKNFNTLKQHQQWFYIIGGLILLGLGTFYFFYRTRLHESRLKTEIAGERIEQQQKETEFQRKLGDISLSALRSQMNPHFIFNCLNSIKLYTTQNDTVAATEYLSKFSKLIRLVMENSHNDRISLSSELNALCLYIEMEVMRFKEKLHYNINVDKDVETDYIEIPPLLLQPYVENAIWHGLMHKEEGGNIDINISMEKNESLLEINIIDNGIGRARSVELRSKSATKHKSYGMKVTSERIALINQIYKTGANVSIHDLVFTDGQPAGTKVTIQIPV